MRFGIATLALLLSWSAPVWSKDGDIKVDINGSTYRVSVKGDVVTVAKKSLFVAMTIDERDAQRAAVRKATGCNIYDEIANGARLKGKLNCAPKDVTH